MMLEWSKLTFRQCQQHIHEIHEEHKYTEKKTNMHAHERAVHIHGHSFKYFISYADVRESCAIAMQAMTTLKIVHTQQQ